MLDAEPVPLASFTADMTSSTALRSVTKDDSCTRTVNTPTRCIVAASNN